MLRVQIRNPSLALLIGLSALLLGYPFVEQSEYGRTLLNLLGIVIVLLATRMISHTRTNKRLVWGFAILPIAAQIVYALHHEPWIAAWVAAMVATTFGALERIPPRTRGRWLRRHEKLAQELRAAQEKASRLMCGRLHRS